MRFTRIFAAWLALLLLAASVPAIAETAPYYITVDIENQIVTVYRTEDTSESGIVRQMICSTGMGTATPVGVFTMPKMAYSTERSEWHYFVDFDLWAKYVSRIKGNYLFHSILFSNNKTDTPTWGSSHSLGSKASHGCVRLRVEDAKWIAENCFDGTVVYIYDDGTRDNDLRRLLLDRTFSADEETYDEFKRGVGKIGRGSSAELIKLAQEKLNNVGFQCGAVDGKFGKNTENAVKSWQEAQKHEPTGTLTFEEMLTLTRMLDVDLEGMLPEIGPQDAKLFDLKPGVDFEGVKQLQERLSLLGYGSIRADGSYGDSTQEAVKAYQNANGMEETGELTYAEYEAILALPTPEPLIQVGSRSEEVRQMQEKLNELGYLSGRADGIFGKSTEQAVRSWQTDNGYEATGMLPASVLNEMLSMSAPSTEPAPTAEPTTAPTSAPTAAPTAEPTAEPTTAPVPAITEGGLARIRAGKSSSVNLRAEASALSTLAGILQNGTQVRILETNPKWSLVETEDGLRGWIYTEYLEMTDEEAEEPK